MGNLLSSLKSAPPFQALELLKRFWIRPVVLYILVGRNVGWTNRFRVTLKAVWAYDTFFGEIWLLVFLFGFIVILLFSRGWRE